MSTDFLHGVETVVVDSGPRPVQTVRSAVIGLIGTAPLADVDDFPLDTPVLVTSRGGYATIGATGTLKKALDGIFDQTGAFVVVVRVSAGANDDEAMANVIGGVSGGGALTGIQAFRAAESLVGVAPMLLIAPGFTSQRPSGVSALTIAAAGTGGTNGTYPLTFTGGGGAGAAGTFTIAGGIITAATITNAGIGYTSAPTVGGITGHGLTGSPSITAAYAAVASPVTAAMVALANQMRAHVVVDGPSTTDGAALTYAGDWDSRRIYMVDPTVKVAGVAEPSSARAAGLIAQVDKDRGFWWSPSNNPIAGINGLGRPIDYALGDTTSRANLLNEAGIATVIRDDGFRLWGNQTLSSDPKWKFLSVSRTADIIDISIQRAHRWAVDRIINKAYFEEVTASVNLYLRQLQARGAILGGKCWVDPDLNTAADIAAGHATFSYDFTPPTPAERVTFQSSVTDSYIATIFAAA